VDALTSLAREKHRGLPLYLLGHSMGGLIAIRYVLANPAGLAGAIISSPALGTHPEFKPPLLLKLMVSVLSRLAPRLLFDSDLDTQAISRKSIKKVYPEAASLQIPMLLMQSGADRLVDPAAPARWAESTPGGLVERVHWDGLYHEMFNEPEKDRVRARVMDWLESLQNS
jgi:lysophospholipase